MHNGGRCLLVPTRALIDLRCHTSGPSLCGLYRRELPREVLYRREPNLENHLATSKAKNHERQNNQARSGPTLGRIREPARTGTRGIPLSERTSAYRSSGGDVSRDRPWGTRYPTPFELLP